MRIGPGRLPRRRDPRRRFRNRLLVGMVGVALLPLVAFAVLAVFELDTVAKSTANATETAILQHQQTLADSALDARASYLDARMTDIDNAVQEVSGALAKAMTANPTTATLPAIKKLTPLGTSFGNVSGGGSTLILPVGTSSDARFVRASETPAVELQVAAILKNPVINAVWFQDAKTGALRAYPVFTPTSGSENQGYDPVSRSLVLSNSEGGIAAASAPNDWIQQGAPGRSTDGPFWTDPYSLLEDGTTGVSAWYQNPSSIQVGVDVSVQKLIAASPSSPPCRRASPRSSSARRAGSSTARLKPWWIFPAPR